ncbi:hypothetical protein PR202_gb19187 [Eleusine coracana subsp. coracana]|uniref:U-box domain-containing protein n=1 Tax=Eleusine coracana subsp. coracana TaxID=191504 RepID=A0AAV5F5C6_ELECO|nr:hypothetical protein PR202_gb19187 [Eleusine coracana subsp. coracana]
MMTAIPSADAAADDIVAVDEQVEKALLGQLKGIIFKFRTFNVNVPIQTLYPSSSLSLYLNPSHAAQSSLNSSFTSSHPHQDTSKNPALLSVSKQAQELLLRLVRSTSCWVTTNLDDMALLARRARRAATKKAAAPRLGGDDGVEVELAIPAHFRCPISLDLMRDPVTAPTGITYDRASIEAWLDTGRATCPVTHAALRHEDLVPNHATRRVIQDWCVANRSRGVERIPTPKIPLTHVHAADLLFDLADAARRHRHGGSRSRCAELVARVRALARDSERNRRCLASVGTARVLAAAFESIASEVAGGGDESVFEGVLAALVCVMPLDDEEAARTLASPTALGPLVGIAEHGTLAGRVNAVLAIKEVISCDGAAALLVTDLNKAHEIVDALVKMIKSPICPQATKAAMVATYHLARFDERVASRVAAAGLVPVLVESLVDADKSASEKALAVLDAVLASGEGRAVARAHALAVPVLVKKMFRVSDMGTELVVSALWRLGCNDEEVDVEEEAVTRCRVEALRVGAFQKLLLLLQVGCRDATKEKATELLKMLNRYKKGSECVDAVDFRGLNRLSS